MSRHRRKRAYRARRRLRIVSLGPQWFGFRYTIKACPICAPDGVVQGDMLTLCAHAGIAPAPRHRTLYLPTV